MATGRIPRWFGETRAPGAPRGLRPPRGLASPRRGWATDSRRQVVQRVLLAYMAVGLVSGVVARVTGHDPLSCAGWFHAGRLTSVLLSLGAGVCLGAATIVVTRDIVGRSGWGRALHAALRPAVHGASDGELLALGIASGAAEEVLFRGLLVPVAGLLLSSVVFGLLHQVRGPGRLGWMAWATIMGLLFGATFLATGSLLGPIVAHIAINQVNLRFVRDNDPEPRPRALGGLLRR